MRKTRKGCDQESLQDDQSPPADESEKEVQTTKVFANHVKRQVHLRSPPSYNRRISTKDCKMAIPRLDSRSKPSA